MHYDLSHKYMDCVDAYVLEDLSLVNYILLVFMAFNISTVSIETILPLLIDVS